jgi:hypothetical protein
MDEWSTGPSPWSTSPLANGPLVRLHTHMPSIQAHSPSIHMSCIRAFSTNLEADVRHDARHGCGCGTDTAADAGQAWLQMRDRHGCGCGAYAGCLHCGRTQSFTRKVAGAVDLHRALVTVHSPPCTRHRALATVHSPPCTRHRALATVHSSPCTSLASAAPGPGGGRRGRLYMCGSGAVREPLYHVARRCGSLYITWHGGAGAVISRGTAVREPVLPRPSVSRPPRASYVAHDARPTHCVGRSPTVCVSPTLCVSLTVCVCVCVCV